MMSMQTTACPQCVCPDCPPVNKCDLSNTPESEWVQMADCFSNNPVRSKAYISVSATRECPPAPTFADLDTAFPDVDASLVH
jgi:hypothetical protein